MKVRIKFGFVTAWILLGISVQTFAGPIITRPQPVKEEDLVIVQVEMDRTVITEGLAAYKTRGDIYVPLKEFSRVLNFAIDVNVAELKANGWMVHEDRAFSVDENRHAARWANHEEKYSPELLIVRPDDFLVALNLVSQWFPIDMDFDPAAQTIHIRPRETIPLQAQLERLRQAEHLKDADGSMGMEYPDLETPYRLIDKPFVDQKFATGINRSRSGNTTNSREYSTFATGDFLGTEGTAFLSGNQNKSLETSRFTFGRTDPDSRLLGFAQAREVTVGGVVLPGHSEVSVANNSGNGFWITNRPFTTPSRFDRQSFSGMLLPGWDAQLFHNGVLIAYQQSRPDGKYLFENVPLLYGVNDYRIVFHGPRGEEREERHRFFLDQSLVEPGKLYYNLGYVQSPEGAVHINTQVDQGIFSRAALSSSFLTAPVQNVNRNYVGIGARGFLPSLFLSADGIKNTQGGTLEELEAKSHLGSFILSGSQAYLQKFVSEVFAPSSDPVRMRTKARFDYSLPLWMATPFSVEAQRDLFTSGLKNYDYTGKLSSFFWGTSTSYELHHLISGSDSATSSILSLSRRFGNYGLRGAVGYIHTPHAGFDSIALAGDWRLSDKYTFNQNLAHTFASKDYQYGLGLNKSLGQYGFGVSLKRTSLGETAGSVQLFLSLGVEPRQGRVVTDAVPIAQTGAASIRVYWDKNSNGIFDSGDEPLKNVGFFVDGAKVMAHTDRDGIAYIDHLPTRQHVNIGLDSGTLEDPQFLPTPKGVRLVPRAGRASEIDFPVIRVTEVDGTITIQDQQGIIRPAGDVQLELVDLNDPGHVISRTKSASDGFYVLTGVPPGRYQVQVNAQQARRLKIDLTTPRVVVVDSGMGFISGIDLRVKKN